MRKFHLWFSLICLLILGIGVYFMPDNPMFWLVSGEVSSQIMRGVLVAAVVIQLVTEPPRHIALRAVTGAVAALSAGYAFYTISLLGNPIFDTIIFLQTAIALTITALELPSEEPRIISERTSAS